MKHTIITGTGRSGTSFVAKCFQRLGFDLGGSWKPEVRAGLEAPESVAANQQIMAADGGGIFPCCLRTSCILDQNWEIRVALDNIERPIIKDPSIANTLDVWIHADKVGRVIFCLRDPMEAWMSFQDTPFKDSPLHTYEMLLARIGYVVWACREHGIVYDTIRWPAMASENSGDFLRLTRVLMEIHNRYDDRLITVAQAGDIIRSVDADFREGR